MTVLVVPLPSLEEVAVQMAIVDSALTSVNPHFTSYAFMPPKGTIGVAYPYGFHHYVMGTPDEHSSSSGSDFFLDVEVNVVILVGPLASNDFGNLSKQAARYIEPIYTLYRANRGINNTVGNTHFIKNFRVGAIPLNGLDHYGLVVPLNIDRRLNIPSRRS